MSPGPESPRLLCQEGDALITRRRGVRGKDSERDGRMRKTQEKGTWSLFHLPPPDRQRRCLVGVFCGGQVPDGAGVVRKATTSAPKQSRAVRSPEPLLATGVTDTKNVPTRHTDNGTLETGLEPHAAATAHSDCRNCGQGGAVATLSRLHITLLLLYDVSPLGTPMAMYHVARLKFQILKFNFLHKLKREVARTLYSTDFARHLQRDELNTCCLTH